MTHVNYLSFSLIGISTCLLLPISVFARESIMRGRQVQHLYQFPYAVSLQDHFNSHICTGGIINELFVITAANCVINYEGHAFLQTYYILAKTTDLHYVSPPAEYVQVRKIYFPAEFNPTNHVGDIAVLQLFVPIKHPFRPNNPLWIHLPGIQFRNIPLRMGEIAGFGNNRRNGTSASGHLQFATIFILPNEHCEQEYPDEDIDTEKVFCGRMSSRQNNLFGACPGDIGSLMVEGEEMEVLVLGVLVRHSPNCDEKFRRGKPSIYTRVSYYEQFIYQAMAQQSHAHLRSITLV